MLDVDTFLLSCRVLGRGVEHHMAAELGRMAQARGAGAVRHARRARSGTRRRGRSSSRSCPPGHWRPTSDGVECAHVRPADLAELRFEPSGGRGRRCRTETAKTRRGRRPRGSMRADSARREEQIVRAAGELATGAGY